MTHNSSQATIDAPYCKPYHPDPSKPGFSFPSGACDTHAHICGPESIHPYDSARIYTPPDALLPAYEHMLKLFGVERTVLVQPSIYGCDNRVMLEAMKETSLEVRGIAVVPLTISDPELELLQEAGIRGIRFNLVDVKNPSTGLPIVDILKLASKIQHLDWHVEFLVHVDDFQDFFTLFKDFPTDIVVCHFGYFRPGCTTDDPGFRGLLQLAEAEKSWIKLTGPYRISAEELPYNDVDIFGKDLIDRVPHRVLWGTDWPHVMMKKRMVDDGLLTDTFLRYTEDENIRNRILVDNPAKLYQF